MDPDAISNAPDDSRVTAVRTNFRFIHNHIRRLGYDSAVDGILADLGVSSHQFDTPERGFSFRFDAPPGHEDEHLRRRERRRPAEHL